VDWELYLSTNIWLLTGWDGLGAIAGEVRDPGKTYIRGVLGANVLIVLGYALPVVAGLAVDPNTDNWEDGYFSTLARQVSPVVGWCVAFSGAISTLGVYNANLSESAFALWAMGTKEELGGVSVRQLPSVFGYKWARYDSPVVALAVQCLFTLVFMQVDFGLLIEVDALLNGISLMSEFAAFIRLRYTEPLAERPYKIPGGMCGAYLVTLPKVLIVGGITFFYDWKVLVFGFSWTLLIIASYYVKNWYVGRQGAGGDSHGYLSVARTGENDDEDDEGYIAPLHSTQ
jgi:amino acid transporter